MLLNVLLVVRALRCYVASSLTHSLTYAGVTLDLEWSELTLRCRVRVECLSAVACSAEYAGAAGQRRGLLRWETAGLAAWRWVSE